MFTAISAGWLVLRSVTKALKRVEDGDILSPPYPPLKRGWKMHDPHSYLRRDPLLGGGIKGGEGVFVAGGNFGWRSSLRSLTWSRMATFSHPPTPL